MTYPDGFRGAMKRSFFGAAFLALVLMVTPAAFGQWAGSSTPGYIYYGGGVGIGTATPDSSYFLDVKSTLGGRFFTDTGIGFGGLTVQANNTALGALLTLGSARGDVYAGIPAANWTVFITAGAESQGFLIETFTNKPLVLGTNNAERLRISPSGNIGIGTTNPVAKLDVNGDLNVTGNIAAKYQDVAEWVASERPLEAATVVVLNTEHPDQVAVSASPYDTKVAGVVSDKPGLLLGEAGAEKSKIATTGRVMVKVDATKVPVRIGDLLVTSDTPGYAMVSTPVTVAGVAMHRPGTIIGKALQALPGGRGEVLVLLSLQ